MELFKFEDTMDSREIARLTGKDHRNVVRDILAQLGQLAGGVLRFEHTYQNEQNGQGYRCFRLPKRECLILAAGYDVTLRAAIIDRWSELETQATPQAIAASLTRMDILRMALEAEEKVQVLEKEVEAARPAVEFVARYVEAKGSKCLSDVAKLLGIPPRKFVARLEKEKILFRRNGAGPLVPFAEHLERGRFELTTSENGEHAFTQTRVTPAGIEWLARRLTMSVAA